MPNDLISRKALLIAMPKDDELYSLDVRRVILNVPSVDAAPVVHSEWVKEENRTNHWHCKNCGLVEGMAHYMMRYCPNCGARMDKEANP